MPKTTVRVSMSSSDISSDPFTLTGAFGVTSDGTAGLDLLNGLTRTKIGTGAVIIADASTFTNTGEDQLAYLFIKNLSTNVSSTVFTDSIIIKVSDGGSNHLTLGHLAGGQSIVLPFSADNDITLTADVANTVVEYLLVHAG